MLIPEAAISTICADSDEMNYTLVSRWVILLVRSHPVQEVSGATFLKQTHEGRTKSLPSIRRDLGHGGFWSVALLDVAASYLLELQVSRHIRRHQDVGELAIGHQKLWNEVDIPIVGASVVLPWLLTLLIV